MFEKTYSNVKVIQKDTPKRGNCLAFSKLSQPEREIYADICGPAIAEGINYYSFGNTIFFVTRWADIKPEEKDFLLNGKIDICFYYDSCANFAVQYDGNGWGDVFPTLCHCMSFMNDESQPVNEIVFIFADKNSGEIIGDRVVKLSGKVTELFRLVNINTHKVCNLDAEDVFLLADALVSPDKDWCDFVYNKVWDSFSSASKRMREKAPEDVNGGIYFDISASNQIVSLRVNKK